MTVPTSKEFAHPRSVRFNLSTSSVVSCQVPARAVSAWTFSTMRLMLFFDGRYPRYAFPVLAEYIRPNVCPRKSNFASSTLQIRVFSSLTVSFSLPMISRNRRSLCGLTRPAQDHEVVGVGHDARAEASLQPEILYGRPISSHAGKKEDEASPTGRLFRQ